MNWLLLILKKESLNMLDNNENKPLVNMTITDFAKETASESPASWRRFNIYIVAMGVSLGTILRKSVAQQKRMG